MENWLGKNWKTTVSGIITAIASTIVLWETFPSKPWYYRLSAIALAGGLASVGIVAKDAER